MSLLAATETFDEAAPFIRRLQDLQGLARGPRTQVHMPFSGGPDPLAFATITQENLIPRLLSGHIFRGQSDSTWGLVPPIFRPGALANLHDGLPDKFSWEHPAWFRTFARKEIELVMAFSWMAQEIGLESPHKTGKFESFLTAIDSARKDNEVSPWLDSLFDISNPIFGEIADEMALAQHHGVPTRLLDWSEDPLLAVYFAVHKHGPHSRSAQDIAVFALDISDFYYAASNSVLQKGLDLVRAPRARDLFIQKQKGLFTIPKQALSIHRKFDFDLTRYAASIPERENKMPAISKLVLCAAASLPTRRMLHDMGYRFHTVFPSLSSITRTLAETEELFGRGKHKYVNLAENRGMILVADDEGEWNWQPLPPPRLYEFYKELLPVDHIKRFTYDVFAAIEAQPAMHDWLPETKDVDFLRDAILFGFCISTVIGEETFQEVCARVAVSLRARIHPTDEDFLNLACAALLKIRKAVGVRKVASLSGKSISSHKATWDDETIVTAELVGGAALEDYSLGSPNAPIRTPIIIVVNVGEFERSFQQVEDIALTWFIKNPHVAAILGFQAGLRSDFAYLKFDCRLFPNPQTKPALPTSLLELRAESDSWGIQVHISKATMEAK